MSDSSGSNDGDEWLLDAILVPVGVLLLIAYNVSFYVRVTKFPLTTVVGVNHFNRRAWVRSIMKDVEKKNILAVQTLRNSIMASTLLASTAMVLCAAIAAFVSSTSTKTTQDAVNSVLLGSHSPVLIAFKFLAVLLCFVFSFMCHVQSIRYTNHVAFLITIPMGSEAPGLTPDYVSAVLARGSDFYTVGTRGFYSAFPLLLWLFGPIPMVVSCAILVPVLYHLDTAYGFSTSVRDEPGEEDQYTPLHEQQQSSQQQKEQQQQHHPPLQQQQQQQQQKDHGELQQQADASHLFSLSGRRTSFSESSRGQPSGERDVVLPMLSLLPPSPVSRSMQREGSSHGRSNLVEGHASLSERNSHRSGAPISTSDLSHRGSDSNSEHGSSFLTVNPQAALDV